MKSVSKFTAGMLVWLVGIQQSIAALPTVTAPSEGKQTGLIDNLRAYMYDGASLVGLIICVVAFLVVGGAIIAAFKNARERETWGNFAVVTSIGVCVIVAVIWLATEAAPILKG